MKTSAAGIELIKRFEGFREKAYKCSAGVWTIGWGHTRGVMAGDHCTIQQAEDYLREDLAKFENWIFQYFPNLNEQNKIDALVALSFNIGSISRDSGLFKALKNNVESDIARYWNMYVKAGGKVLLGLRRRRLSESTVYLNYPDLKNWTLAINMDDKEITKEVTRMISFYEL